MLLFFISGWVKKVLPFCVLLKELYYVLKINLKENKSNINLNLFQILQRNLILISFVLFSGFSAWLRIKMIMKKILSFIQKFLLIFFLCRYLIVWELIPMT